MTESVWPRPKPSTARPRARSRTWSRYSRQVSVCQIPRSFSRMAGRAAWISALRSSRRGSVSASAMLDLAEIRRDDPAIGAHLVGLAFGDLLAHVEDRDPIRDVHDHAHVVLDEDDGAAPFLVHVEDEAR